jgi:hypothetical protein
MLVYRSQGLTGRAFKESMQVEFEEGQRVLMYNQAADFVHKKVLTSFKIVLYQSVLLNENVFHIFIKYYKM